MTGTGKAIAGGLMIGFGGLCLAMGAGGPAMAQAVVATGVGTPFELAFWQSIDSSNDASLYDAYLAHFPNGTFGEIAHAKIVSLRGRVSMPMVPALTVPVAPSAAPLGQVPVPAAVRVMQPAVPIVQPTVASPAVATPAVATVAMPTTGLATTGLATTTPAGGTLGQLLAALATSQTSEGGAQTNVASANAASANAGFANAAPQTASLQSATLISGPAQIAPAPIAPHATAVSFAMPAQPALYPVPAVAFPPSFCSAEQRNAFHDQIYAPSVNTAQRNNEAASGYLHQLQALYDQYQLSRDPDTMNAIVVAARTYGQVAQTTFSMQAALVRQFPTLMAVPVVPCTQQGQPSAAVLVK
jgi:hypothetical protein